MDRSHNYPKMLGRTGSPIMTECTAAMVSCCHLIDRSQSLLYLVPQEYHSQAGSTRILKFPNSHKCEDASWLGT